MEDKDRKDTFLESKIETPTAPRNFLIRERLIRRLNDAEERLVIVSAGMGYGKTVLLTHYAKRYPEKCAWYHLSDTDNDIMVFARYLRKAVAKIAPDFSPDFSPYLTLDQNEALVRNLALDFAAAFRALGERELCLVLDDFQTVTSDWIFQFLNMLWDSDHGGLRLFLCTKSAPPPFCARYLLERGALVLGADSLAFNLDEIRLLVEEYTVPEQLDAVTKAIQTNMEGWPAGVSFALLYFRQRQTKITERDMDSACQQSYLRDYFMHELFRKLPFELQQFLSCTSVLDYLRPDVCNALAGIDNASGQLSYLERENLFILRLSGGGQIYRYHAMFRNFLVSQLQHDHSLRLLEQAADFYLRTPDKAQAAEYAIACGDGVRLQTALESAGAEALVRGQLDTLRRWLEELRAMGTPPTAEILLLTGQYCERIGDWQRALDLVGEITRQPPGQSGERCWLEAKLLWARVAREHLSSQKSLTLLDEIMPRLRPERPALRPLYRQATELRVHNLLDLGQNRRALELALGGVETGVQEESDWMLSWHRELAATCYFAMGEYRRAMQLYVVLRGNGGGGSVASRIDLYLAVSGQAKQAFARLRQTLEAVPDGISRGALEELLLIQTLVGQLMELEETGSGGTDLVQARWDGWVPDGGFSGHGFGGLTLTLRRALLGEFRDDADEDAFFRPDSGRFLTLHDGACWLTVRRKVRSGDRQRALELCRRALANRTAPEENESERLNAFLAFLLLEEALLLREEEPAQAAALAEQCAPYLTENRLVCPGLTAEEQTAAEVLFSAGGGLPQPAAEAALSGGPLRVTVHCFGRFQVFLPDGQELHWRTRKTQELFAYLFHLAGACANRERLVDLLWPQATPGSATSLLHTSLYSIRKGLAPYGLDGLFRREKQGYRMNMELVDSPRARVDALCRGDETPEGADLPTLYEGLYLEDVEAVWAEDDRAWYAGAFLRSCKSLAETRMDRGDFRGAADCLRAAARQEPYDEGLAALLIRCYAAMGEIKNAMAQYQRLKETLAEDLDTEPGEEVTHTYKECLLRRLGTGRSS